MRTILVVNKSTLVKPDDLKAAVAAVQTQLNEHVAPVWGMTAQLVPADEEDPQTEAVIILDDPLAADALGFHELLGRTEIPRGYVFVRTSQEAGVPWTVPFSHELIEMLIDPFIYGAAIGTFGGYDAALALEPADAVEMDTYLLDGVPVSNFVFPAWFDETKVDQHPFDFLGLLKEPCELRPGGYIGLTYNLRSWKEVTHYRHGKGAYRSHAGVNKYSRKQRRTRARPAK